MDFHHDLLCARPHNYWQSVESSTPFRVMSSSCSQELTAIKSLPPARICTLRMDTRAKQLAFWSCCHLTLTYSGRTSVLALPVSMSPRRHSKTYFFFINGFIKCSRKSCNADTGISRITNPISVCVNHLSAHLCIYLSIFLSRFDFIAVI